MMRPLWTILLSVICGLGFASSETTKIHYVEDPHITRPAVYNQKVAFWPKMRVLVVLLNQVNTEMTSCKLEVSPHGIVEAIEEARRRKDSIVLVTPREFQDLLSQCHMTKALAENAPYQVEDPVIKKALTWPGLKWCGPGDNANHSDDLGEPKEVDMCCRDHDLCDDVIPSGESKHGLSNNTPFTRLNCKCDDDFRKCLQNLRNRTANAIGQFYFNFAQLKCYTYDYPLGKCLQWGGFLGLSCQEYEKDTTKEKVWQWVHAKEYVKPED